MKVEIGNIVSYRFGEQKRGYLRSCRSDGLPVTRKFAEKTDPDAYGVGIVLDVTKCGDVKQPQSWSYKCVITLETNRDDTDFAMVYWCGNSVLEFIDPVFLDVIKESACAEKEENEKVEPVLPAWSICSSKEIKNDYELFTTSPQEVYMMGDCVAQCMNCIRQGKDGYICNCGNPSMSMYYHSIQQEKRKYEENQKKKEENEND